MSEFHKLPPHERLLIARASVHAAVRFLRENQDLPPGRDRRAIAPSLLYDSGVLDALNWMLGVDPDHLFERHLEGLIRVRDAVEAQTAP